MSANDFAERYPHIERYVLEHGWVEFGVDDYNQSFIRALDQGGMVWEGKSSYPSLDDALGDLETNLAHWYKEGLGEETSQ